MLTRTLRFMCSQAIPRTTQVLRRFQLAQESVRDSKERLQDLTKQIEEEDKKLAIRNKQVHEMRVQLTNDVKKGDQIWRNTKKKADAHRKQSVQNFARGLVEMGQNLIEIQALETEQHDLDMREGFHLTSRLFFNTLEKYKILKYQPEAGLKFNKDTMHLERQVKCEKKEQKDTVAELIENGWEAEDVVIKKAKVAVYK